MTAPRALSVDDPDGIALLRQALRSSGFATERVPELVGEPGVPAVARTPLVLARLPDEGALSVLVRLFLLGLVVDRTEAEVALRPLPLARAVRMGLVRPDGRLAGSPIRLIQFDGFVVASDAPEMAGMAPDHVMAVSGSSMFLSHLTVRRPVSTALDVGCGTGIQALLASRHTEHVVGTDSSARAVSFARFNAALNDVDNVEFREGSLFEPVDGESFDLIVSNPPFVVSPDAEFLYRDSPNPGDEISRDIVRGAAEHLAPGGIAAVLVGWVRTDGSEWWERPAGWPGDGFDVWLFHHSTMDSLAYAVQWNQHLKSDTDTYLGTVSRWVDHYRRHEIGAIGYGAVVLRRRDGATWRRVDDLDGRYPTIAGDVLHRLMTLEDRLADPDGVEAILDERPTANRNHRIDQVLRVDGTNYAVQRAALTQDDGLRLQVQADPLTAELLAACDGRRTLREVVVGLRDSTTSEGATEEQVGQAILDAAIRMLRLGFLVLPD